MPGELVLMNRSQLEEALAPTENLSHIDVTLGTDDGVKVNFKEHEEAAAEMEVGDGQYLLTTNGLEEAARCVGIPRTYSDKCPKDLLFQNLNFWFSGGASGKLRFFLQDGKVIGCNPNRPKYYSNLQMIDIAQGVMGPENVMGYHQVHTDLAYSRMAVITNHRFEARPDDFLHGGISIHNSIIGEKKIQITPYIFRQWCSNGAFVSENISQWSHRNDESQDIGDWLRTSTDLAVKALDNEFHRIHRLTEISVDHPVEALQSLFVKFNIPVRIQSSVIAAAQSQQTSTGSPDMTMYDLWNAFTYVATHVSDLSWSSRDLLQNVAGGITKQVELCPHCHQLVSIGE